MITITFVISVSLPFANKVLQMVRSYNSAYEIKYGKEIIYSFIDRGDERIADEILKNKYELSRFSPVEIDAPTWREDPFSDIYWRFNYYNLEPVRNLLFAWMKTNNPAYRDKLIEITESFIDTGMNGPYSWDKHGTAFRTMTLVDVWWKLRNNNQLPDELSQKIIEALKVHGEFLADPNHFEGYYNHGLDQAAALYLLAVDFPDLPKADQWLALASERIDGLLAGIVDEDGVLVENSPYYHFYVLEKLWEINAYSVKYNLFISAQLDEKLNKMISYAAYVLQPDLAIPTIGASLKESINLAGVYTEMAKSHPDLLYVLTQGAKGTKPANLNVQYPVGGQTIMRSGWGKGNEYANQTQLIFDVGSYRTDHSDLDALSFNLYSNGLALMPDAGLYTYEPGPYRTYFHGTRSHNTVVVDGKDQDAGEKIIGGESKVNAGSFEEGDGYVYQSGEHELYQGVSHARAITMIEGSTILIFDNLTSDSERTYEQMFHIFPGAEISADGLTVTAKSKDSKQTMTIRQLMTDGMQLNTAIDKQNPIDGLCSTQYKIAVPCYSLAYLQKGKNASYITVISIGKDQATVNLDTNSNVLRVETQNGLYSITIDASQGSQRSIEINKNFDMSHIYSSIQPLDALNALSEWYNATNDGEGDSVSAGFVNVNARENSLEITPPFDGSYMEVAHDIDLDLSNKNLYFKIKTNKSQDLEGVDLYLSNDHWQKSIRYNLTGGEYNVERNDEWLRLGVGKGADRNINLGNWVISDPTFDWSTIDSVKFLVAAKAGKNVAVDIKDFNLVPDQKEARAVIMFDDGWGSVMDAAAVMNIYGMKGNVPVITGSVGAPRYLTLDNLKTLQNEYGWNIVNHSKLHKDGVAYYVDAQNMKGYEEDITDALAYLIKNGINSAPNWFVYPYGKVDAALKNVIGKYYKFGRSTIDSPELFPFADPLEVKIISVYSYPDISTADILNAISDAQRFNQTIIFMFHKFSVGVPKDYHEWQLSEFEAILKGIQEQGIKVVTLSELDQENGVPQTQFTVHDFTPPQFKLGISVQRKTLLQRWGFSQ